MLFFKTKQSAGLTEYLASPHSYSLDAVGIPANRLSKITADCEYAIQARNAIWAEMNDLSMKYTSEAFKDGNFSDYVGLTVTMAKFLQEESRNKDALSAYLRAAYYYVNFDRGLQAMRLAEKGKKNQCSALLHDSFLQFTFDLEEIFILDADNGIMDLYMHMMREFRRYDQGVMADYELTRALVYMHDGRHDDLEKLCDTVAARLVDIMKLSPSIRSTQQEMEELKPLWNEYAQISGQIENEWALVSNLKDYQGERAENFIALCSSVVNQYAFFLMADKSASNIKSVPAYTRLVMIFETRKEYDLATHVCCDAIIDGLDFRKQLARNIGKQHRDPTKQEAKLLNETL